ncbi:MAG: PD-(D/E)XK motif protein, partial [Gudongella sp.]|nr:PD-(D/E)XK motif protein [Gudongella sp.]
FAYICEDFVSTDSEGIRRKEILNDPESYWNDWKELLGNRSSDDQPQQILAELIVLDILQKRGEKPEWSGPEMGSVDIRASSVDYEVKSSRTKYGFDIRISSDNQLKRGKNELHLCYCVFEKSVTGISINTVLENLERHGANIDDIKIKLAEFDLDSASLNQCFQVLKMIDFLIYDSFPKITPESFKGDMLPEGIKSIQYTIDVSNIPEEYKKYLNYE